MLLPVAGQLPDSVPGGQHCYAEQLHLLGGDLRERFHHQCGLVLELHFGRGERRIGSGVHGGTPRNEKIVARLAEQGRLVVLVPDDLSIS